MKIALILPTFNNDDLTLKCIESIDTYACENCDITILWVDNNSSLDSKKLVLNKFKELKNVKFENIFLTKNLGFIKAVNIGLKYLLNYKFDYIGILNNDIEVTNNWLEKLIDVLKSDKNIMCVGPISYKSDKNTINEPEMVEFKELQTVNFDTFDETKDAIEKLNLEPTLYSFKDFEDIYKLKANVAYFCTLFKPIIFTKIGLLNENFNFGYSDDTEFNFRITKAGYKIAKVKNLLVIHNHRSTFKKIFGDDQNIQNIQYANRLQLKISKLLNNNKTKKYVIYTAIIDDYDNLKVPSYINTDDFDYVCFTNTPSLLTLNIHPWTIININDIINNIEVNDHVKWARFFKTHPHLFFENYEKSIWIDSNIDIIEDPMSYIPNLKNGYILVPDHPVRNDIYEEIKACYELKKDDDINLKNIQNFLMNEGYPGPKGKLTQTNILLRDHHNKECIFLMEKWWNIIQNYSKRDQLSFNYVFWKYGGRYMSIPFDLISLRYFTTDYKHKR